MPTKERYERDKAYYHEWNTSDKGKAADRRKHKKRAAEGRCLHCGRPFEKYLGEHQLGCMYSPSGSFATDYAEMAGYSPSEIGFVKVIVKDKQIIDVQKTVV